MWREVGLHPGDSIADDDGVHVACLGSGCELLKVSLIVKTKCEHRCVDGSITVLTTSSPHIISTPRKNTVGRYNIVEASESLTNIIFHCSWRHSALIVVFITNNSSCRVARST